MSNFKKGDESRPLQRYSLFISKKRHLQTPVSFLGNTWRHKFQCLNIFWLSLVNVENSPPTWLFVEGFSACAWTSKHLETITFGDQRNVPRDIWLFLLFIFRRCIARWRWWVLKPVLLGCIEGPRASRRWYSGLLAPHFRELWTFRAWTFTGQRKRTQITPCHFRQLRQKWNYETTGEMTYCQLPQKSEISN